MRLIAMSLIFCAALTTGGFAAERISPAAGQTIEEFDAANDAELTATPGNKMGYTVQKCPLKPPPFGGTEEIFIGYGPRHSHGDETKVDLIGVRDGKVTEWKEFLLPDFEGWLTHFVWECKVRTFQVLDNSKVYQRFRWTGTHFEKIATATKRK